VDLADQHRALELEQAKSERLLLNVLPEPVARRLKDHGGVIADASSDVTVLFADIVGFTPLSERLSPSEVVALLDGVFAGWDALAARHGVEKIKTIGDAYMVAGGIPLPRDDHAEAIADMALAMGREIERCAADNGMPLRVRIGIDTGPVVAGVIGRAKFIYDLWGDTVNTASRMESHAQPGTIQVTERAYERLRSRYELRRRGIVDVKGKGPMTTYLLLGATRAARGARRDRDRAAP
jgi:class 3 adenylate cyclase